MNQNDISKMGPGARLLLPATIENLIYDGIGAQARLRSVTLYIDGMGRITVCPAQLREALPVTNGTKE